MFVRVSNRRVRVDANTISGVVGTSGGAMVKKSLKNVESFAPLKENVDLLRQKLASIDIGKRFIKF
jgi:hypothetical protein